MEHISRAQALVIRGNRVLMVKHRQNGEEYWILPGGGIERGEAPAEAAVRELREECGISGTVLRFVGYLALAGDNSARYTYLIDAGEQEPVLGADPEFDAEHQILAEAAWKSLDELSERDRAWLFSSGALCSAEIENELEGWTREIIPPKKGVKL